jgi:hypothetical protein
MSTVISDIPKLKMIKYTLIKDIYVYYLELGKQLIVLVNAPSGFRRLKDYITNKLESTVFDLVVQVNSDLKRLNYSEVYCIGHSAGGLYSKYLASYIKINCITVGELNADLPEPYLENLEYIRYVSNKDLLVSRRKDVGLIVEIETKPFQSTLEGLIAHSIDSYMNIIPTLN